MDEQFAVEGSVAAEVRLGNGRIVVQSSEAGTVSASVEPADPEHAPSVRLATSSAIRLKGHRLQVSVPESRRSLHGGEVLVTLRVPPSSRLDVRAARVAVHVRDGLDALEVTLAAGEVDADRVARTLSVKAGQVDVVVASAGAVSVTTGQGTLRAQQVGDAAFKVAQGEVELGSTTGKVVVRGAAVQLTVRAAGPGSLDFQTAAGGASVAVVPGTTVQLDMTSATGAVRCELPPESDDRSTGGRLDLRLRSATGNLLVTSAAAD